MNKKIIGMMEPKKILILSTIFWLISFLISPLSVQINLNPIAYLLYIASFGFFILGSLTYNSKKILTKKLSDIKISKVFYWSLLMAFIGVLFRFVDRFLLRGIAVQNNYLENRTAMEEESGNIFAILSNILIPSIYIVIYLQLKYKIFHSFVSKLFIFSLFLFPVFDSILLGSRSNIFILFLFILFTLFHFEKIKFSLTKSLVLLFIVVGFIIMMSKIFIERTSTFAGDTIYDLVLNDSNINYTITSKDEFKTSFEEKSDMMKSILFSYSVTTQYVVHGLFEFSYLYSNFNGNHTYGGYTFFIYKRFILKLLNIPFNATDLYSNIPRTGVYTTLLGPLYIDFGWFAIIFMFLFGRLYKYFYLKSISGNDVSTLILFFFALVIFFSPIFNFINGAGGIFLITNFVGTYTISKIRIKLN